MKNELQKLQKKVQILFQKPFFWHFLREISISDFAILGEMVRRSCVIIFYEIHFFHIWAKS